MEASNRFPALLQKSFCQRKTRIDAAVRLSASSSSQSDQQLKCQLFRSRCTQAAEASSLVIGTPGCVNRHGVSILYEVSKRHSAKVAGALGGTKCMTSLQGGTKLEDVDGARSRSASGCGDVGAFRTRQCTLERLQAAGVIACLRSESEEVALNAGRAALDGGVSVVEVTMRMPEAFQVIKTLVNEYPSATIGAGTVLTREDAGRAEEAGATFTMSPVSHKELIQAHVNTKVLFIPGAMTPSEVLKACRWGASCVKLYPVSLLGGVQYAQLLKKMFSHIPIIPSGGISLDMVESYLQTGASAVVTSDAVFNKVALARHDYAHISRLSKAAVALAAKAGRVSQAHLITWTR